MKSPFEKEPKPGASAMVSLGLFSKAAKATSGAIIDAKNKIFNFSYREAFQA